MVAVKAIERVWRGTVGFTCRLEHLCSDRSLIEPSIIDEPRYRHAFFIALCHEHLGQQEADDNTLNGTIEQCPTGLIRDLDRLRDLDRHEFIE